MGDGETLKTGDVADAAPADQGLGFDPDALERSLHDVFVRRDSVDEVALPVPGVQFLDEIGRAHV